MRRLPLATLAAVAFTAVPTARAATVGVIGESGYRSYREHVEYIAEPGEANHVLVTGSRTSVRVEDTGAVLTPRNRCSSDGPHVVVCTLSSGDPTPYQVVAHTGDGSDEFDVTLGASVDLGTGDDTGRIRGGGELDGGEGRDTLTGGPEADTFRDGDRVAFVPDVIDGAGGLDLVDYSSRGAELIVDLRQGRGGQGAEGDTLRGIESAAGGSGNDLLIAGPATAALLGMAGNDRIVGGPGNDLLAGGPGSDVILGAGGNDVIEPAGAAQLALNGPGERQTASGYAPDDGAFDRVNCGGGRDHVSELGYDRIGTNCEFFHFNDQTTNGRTTVPTLREPVLMRMRLGCSGEAQARVMRGRLRGHVVAAVPPCSGAQRRRPDVVLRLNETGRALLRQSGCTELAIRVRGNDLLAEPSARPAWFSYRYVVC